MTLCSLPLSQASKTNYYYYHICVSWIVFLANASTFTSMILVEGAIRIKEPYPTITALTAIILVTRVSWQLTELPPMLHFYFAFKVLPSLMLKVPHQPGVVQIWSLQPHQPPTLLAIKKGTAPPSLLFSQQDIWFLLWGYSYGNLVSWFVGGKQALHSTNTKIPFKQFLVNSWGLIGRFAL